MERFWTKVRVGDDAACWAWLGALAPAGYGRFRYEGRTAQAHRVAWELTNGKIPAGLVIDHLCRNRACVNPAHMEVVTQGENIRRGDSLRVRRENAVAATHCKNGHAWAEHAVQYATRRRCSECMRANAMRAYHRAKASRAT